MMISIVLILPLSSMAEDRVRFSYRLGGSVSDPALGTKSVSFSKLQQGLKKEQVKKKLIRFHTVLTLFNISVIKG